ncbi:MAG: hypothetical protein HQM00_15175, partial [Magnetococcales bacterium]|nr:hypothetical protein [Magnetococcales bacterium]
GDEAIRKAVLQKPEDLGLTVLSTALQQSDREANHQLLTVAHPESGENWQVGLHHLPVHQQGFRVATLAPESDSQTISGQLVAVLIGVMGAIAAVAMVAAFSLVNAVRRPITRAFAELAASHINIEARTVRRTLVSKIAAQLQQAHTPAQLAQILLSELAGPL